MTGRLIVHGTEPPLENMAMDEALLRSCEAGREGFPALRFYRWAQPTLSLGAKEKPEAAADLEACRRAGIALVRRPTGGRAVLHSSELTYSVVAPLGRPPFVGSVVASYRRIAEAMRRGLAAAGAELELTAGSRRAPRSHLPCFAAPSRCELAWRGRKVVGSAQRRLRASALQHGSILLRSDAEALALATGAAPKARARLASAMVGLEEVLGRQLTHEELVACLVPPMAEVLGAELTEADLTGEERRIAVGLLDSGRFEVPMENAQTADSPA